MSFHINLYWPLGRPKVHCIKLFLYLNTKTHKPFAWSRKKRDLCVVVVVAAYFCCLTERSSICVAIFKLKWPFVLNHGHNRVQLLCVSIHHKIITHLTFWCLRLTNIYIYIYIIDISMMCNKYCYINSQICFYNKHIRRYEYW
jgi:hypothetical protein